jgi:hypothetical protein
MSSHAIWRRISRTDGVQLHKSEVMTAQAVAAVPQGGGIRVHSIK